MIVVMIKLRGHHLICIHFFKGEGYSKAFLENLREVVKRTEKKTIEIVTGGDDVCVACPSFKNNRCMHNGDSELEMRQLDALALRLLGLDKSRVKWNEVGKILPSIIGEWRANGCSSCEWLSVCESTPLWRSM